MTHHDRDAILARFTREDRFVLRLDNGDTAWDPETGDNLTGPALVTFARGLDQPFTATIDRLAAAGGWQLTDDTTPAVYDPAAQHARELALPGFLDLNLDQWETWLLSADVTELPDELEPYAVAVITALRDPDGRRGDYLQAVAALDTSALRYFADRVGKR